MKTTRRILGIVQLIAMCWVVGTSMATAPATYDCNCSGNLLKNPSFESTSDWQKTSGTDFSTSTAYNVCGSKNGVIDGSGAVYQLVEVPAGAKVDFSIYGGTHNASKSHKIKLTFLNSSEKEIDGDHNISKEMDYQVGQSPTLQKYTMSSTAPSGTKYVKVEMTSSGNYFKMDMACLTITQPSACTTCDGNLLGNDGSFESGNTSGWYHDGDSFSANKTYAVCGTYGAVFDGPGSFWRRLPMNDLVGRTVNLAIWGAIHNRKNQKFFLGFNDSNNNPIGNYVSVDINKIYDSSPKGLSEYKLSALAPSGAKYIVIGGYSTGDYIKVDAACLTISAPSECVNCDNNLLTDGGSFESGNTSGWSVEGGSFGADSRYAVCGNYGAAYGGSGSFYKDIQVDNMGGRTVSLSAWGAYHQNKGQNFFVKFLDASKNQVGSVTKVNIDKDVDANPQGLKKYNLTALAPAGAKYIRVGGATTGDWIKVDKMCLTITQPVECTNCTNNLVKDEPGFENGNTTGWTSSGGSFSASTSYAACGNYSGVQSGAGTIKKTVFVNGASGNTIELYIWAGYDSKNSQKISMVFLNSSQNTIGAPVTVNLDKAYEATPQGLKKYTLTGTAPSGTEYIRIEGTTSGNKLIVDAVCLTMSGPPLPVTLTHFDARVETGLVQLNWATTFETNSDYFEVQRSKDGKNWAVIGQVNASRESNVLATYDFKDLQPLNGSILYRLRMIDQDNSFAYSRKVAVESKSTIKVTVYPNPTTDIVTFVGPVPVVAVELFNTYGQKLFSGRPDAQSRLDLSSLPQGSYMAKMRTEDGSIEVKRIQVLR
ncbi:T9SS type A sorting domain-containing protein [Dyadobacter tibetensis]|uniref:T9SS type A sorting domain-containing protein n=1 Tax=Dyadobacter tibetensis TaxID=1211851 RepID=UPI0018DD64DE|nr:T9SS type A sorting domain-containing protein [Dyadobacter tibetensis]